MRESRTDGLLRRIRARQPGVVRRARELRAKYGDPVPAPALPDDLARFVVELLGGARYHCHVDHVETGAELPELPMTLYSQRDPRWRNEIYAGGQTFGRAGCYVTCVAMVASLIGSTDTPLEVAAKLREANCFAGPELAYPQNIPMAYPDLLWLGRCDWRERRADLARLRAELELGPAIIEVDFKPATSALDQHFVVALEMTEDRDDVFIADPQDGSETLLLERYATENWDLARAIFGMRLLRPALYYE